MSFDFELPHDWHWETIDSLKAPGRSIVSGPFGSSIGKRFFVGSGVPVVRGNNLSLGMERFNDDGFVFLTEEKAAEFKNCEAHPGDLLFTAAGTIGQVGLIPPKPRFPMYIISNKQLRARLNPARVQPLFAYYWYASPAMVEMIQSRNTGSTIPLINLSVLRSLPIPVPPLDVQRLIVEILSTLDDRITLLRETNTLLEQIAQTIFKSWFVDFDPVRAKQEGRMPEGMDEETAALFPDSFEESELGMVPRGWKISSLDGISDVGIGKTPPRKETHWFSYDTDDMRWVSIRDMGDSGTYLTETSECLTIDAVNRHNVRLVPDNTVLLSFKMTIGRVAITDGEMTTNEAIAHCKIMPQSPVSSEYIYLHLKQFDYSKLSSTSSIADAVNSKTVKSIPIIIPDRRTVDAFQEVTGPIFSRIKSTQHQAQILADLRDTLLPRLISGKLRLPEVNLENVLS